jgi:deazaflavin-dependent oxidoreductase (nitroreductase family)
MQNDVLKDRLSRSREIKITVTGRKSGRAISNPVWFVFENDKLYLLPVQGSDTQWYKNVLKNPTIQVDAGSAKAEVKVIPVTDAKQVSSVVEKFRAKYGAGDVMLRFSVRSGSGVFSADGPFLRQTPVVNLRPKDSRHVRVPGNLGSKCCKQANTLTTRSPGT